MKNILCIIMLLMMSLPIEAQIPEQDPLYQLIDEPMEPEDTTKYWKLSSRLGINFTQTYYQNWLPGGESAISNINQFTASALYRKGNSKWNNFLRMAYGYIILTETDEFSKTDDLIEFLSSYYQKASFGKYWYWAGIMTARTQFTEGFEPPDSDTKTSDFASPLFGFAGVGPAYSPNDDLSVVFAPISTKLTLVIDQTLANAGAYGVEPAVVADDGTIIEEGRNARWEFGGYVSAYWNRDDLLTKDLDLLINFWAFRSYLGRSDNFDFNLEILLQYKLKEWLDTSFNLILFYDDDFGDITATDEGLVVEEGQLQIKEVFVISFAFKLKN